MPENDDLSERLTDFAVRVIKLSTSLPGNQVGRHISAQLLRSGTSAGANYEEARGAESRADFVHKTGIALKELKETRYWLRLVARTRLIKPTRIDSLLGECEQLCAILASSFLTAKRTPVSKPSTVRT